MELLQCNCDNMVLSLVKNFIGGLTAAGHSNKLCEVLVQMLQEYGFSWRT